MTAVSVFGTPLSNTVVDAFVDEEGKDRVALFHSGLIASGVPLGKYRITVHAESAYIGSTFEVDVAAPDVLITAGLEWAGVENIKVTARLRGKLKGFPSELGDLWCRAFGLYSRLEYESAVAPEDLAFDFGDVPPGVYVVACVADQKFVAVRAIRIAADAAPFTIDYKAAEDGEAVKH